MPITALSIVPDEIVPPGTTITATLDTAVDQRSASAAVSVTTRGERMRVDVAATKRGRSIAITLPAEATGACELVVSELLGVKGERVVEEVRVPFSVLPLPAKLPDGLRVEHAVRLVLGDLQVVRLDPGTESPTGHIDALKTVDRSTGEPFELAFDEHGERVDLEARLQELAARRADRFGRLDETLFEHLADRADDERIAVVVWPRIEQAGPTYEKPTDRPTLEMPDEERKDRERAMAATRELRTALKRAKVEIEDSVDDVPCVRATATVADLRKLATHRAVGVIHFDDTSEILDLGDSIAVARSDSAHAAGFDGTGVRVAVWESGPSVTTNLAFAGRFTTSPSASNHARLTSAVVKNTEAGLPHGHAPDCNLYSANTSGTDALRWAVRDPQLCTVVSQSFHRNTEPGGAGLQSDDLLKDWLALRWPYPTFLQAAGNFWQGDADNIQPPESEFVNHKGFNSLAVGSHDDSAGAMATDSVFRNPSSTHGDRELPEIAANGTGVSANSQSMSGTSFAAPAAAGVTALLQDVDATLCSWPEGCRAILMASAGRNVRGSTWWQDVVSRVDARDGAGAVDAHAGVVIAQQRRWRDAPATRRGWDIGTISSGVIGSDRLATFRYRIAVPALVFAPTVKVALAWDSAVTSSGDTPTASTLTVDLDLLVRDSTGAQVASAASWDNSYEVVEFAAQRGETYEIVIRRWSGTADVWYGVAWTVSGISIFRPIEWDLEITRGLRER